MRAWISNSAFVYPQDNSDLLEQGGVLYNFPKDGYRVIDSSMLSNTISSVARCWHYE